MTIDKNPFLLTKSISLSNTVIWSDSNNTNSAGSSASNTDVVMVHLAHLTKLLNEVPFHGQWKTRIHGFSIQYQQEQENGSSTSMESLKGQVRVHLVSSGLLYYYDEDDDDDQYTNLSLSLSASCSFYSHTPHFPSSCSFLHL